MSAALVVAVNGNTLRLIPLYAIGVFTGFTLSQVGLVVHWWHDRPRRWRYRAAINATGATTTAVATVIFLTTKFTSGGWVVVVAVPVFIFMFRRVYAYYDKVRLVIGLGAIPPKPERRRTVVVVPVTGVSKLAQHALSEALSISKQVVAVRVIVEDAGGEESSTDRALQDEWQRWGPGVPLHVLHTEYASVVRPIVEFIDGLHQQHDDQIVVLVPVVVPDRLRYRLLHNHLDTVLSNALRSQPDVVVARVATPLSVRGA